MPYTYKPDNMLRLFVLLIKFRLPQQCVKLLYNINAHMHKIVKYIVHKTSNNKLQMPKSSTMILNRKLSRLFTYLPVHTLLTF